MSLSRTVSEINGDFSRKSQILPISRVFNVPAEGVPLELGTDSRDQKIRMMWLPEGQQHLKIGLAV